MIFEAKIFFLFKKICAMIFEAKIFLNFYLSCRNWLKLRKTNNGKSRKSLVILPWVDDCPNC